MDPQYEGIENVVVYVDLGQVVAKLDELQQSIQVQDIADVLKAWELGGVTDPLGQLISWLWSKISESFEWLNRQIWNYLMTFRDWILSGVSSFIDSLRSWLSGVLSAIQDSVSSLFSSFQSFVSYVYDAFANVAATVSSIATQIATGIQSIINSLMTAITQLGTVMQSALTAVQSFIANLINAISATMMQIWSVVSNIPNILWQGIQTLWSWIQSGLQTIATAVAQIPQLVTSAIQSLASMIQQGFEYVTGQIQGAIAGFVEGFRQAFTQLSQTITDVFNRLAQGLNFVYTTIQGFINAILKFPEWFPKWFYDNIAKPIADAIQGLAAAIWEAMPEDIKSIVQNISDFISNPLAWAQRAIEQFRETVANAVKTVSSAVWNTIKALGDALKSTIQAIAEWGRALADWIYSTYIKPIEDAFKSAVTNASSYIAKVIKGEEKIVGELQAITPIVYNIAVKTFPAIVPAYTLQAVAEAAGDQEVSLEPVGLGARVRLRLSKLFSTLSRAYTRLWRDVTRDVALGITVASSFWLTEGIRYRVREAFRNFVPFELPTLTEGRHIVQRHMPHPKFDELYEKYRKWLELRGYPDDIIKLFMAKADEAFVTIKDRFDKERKVPTSLLYDIPTASELCRMMVRDMFKGLDDFAKAMQMRGYVKDLAYMFYLLHFRYPSPEKLWEFTVRGIAGLLWFNPTNDMRQDAQAEAQKIGAFVPKAPIELNFNYSKLLSAFTTYMKWHDMARFAWISEYTCDNWLYIDVLADIPTKIDVRWMTKWGIFELMSQKNIGLKTPVSEFTKVLEPSAANPKVTMDLVLMCRLLQATGLHPYYVPITAVAEAINALADERTLLRTGFINLFKEGFFNLKTVEELLSGLVKASFKVAYFDLARMDWDTKWINIPVMFLPAERKLLELRALMDRALDLLRDYVYELRRAAAENVINPKEFAKYLNDFVLKLNNDWFVPEIKEISGVEKGLVVDEAYYKFYQEIVEQYYRIYTVRRIRSWLGWLLRNLMYRIERGYVTKGEVKKLIDELKATARLTDEETKVMEDVANFMASLFVRETRARAILRRVARGVLEPEKAVEELTKLGLDKEEAEALVEAYGKIYTLSIERMISMMEYIPVPEDMFNKKIKMMGVPEDEAKLLKPYALARVLSSEVGRYITELITDYARGVITRDEFLRELDDVQKLWGVAEKFRLPWMILSPEEKEVLIKLADARRKRYEARYRRR